MSRWSLGMSAIAGVLLSFSPAWALPVPKLPPEATDKPSVVVRIRPIGDLLKDVKYVAKMVGQEEVFNAFEPGMQPVLDSLDLTRPVGFYARVGSEGVNSFGVLLLPVKNEKDFLGLLNQLGVNPVEGEGGLYKVNVPGSPFGAMFRFANGYVYATLKNTDEAEAGLAPAKLFAPQALFRPDDNGVASVTFNGDAIPNKLKMKALDLLEEGLRKFRADELPKQPNEVVRAFADTVAEELAIKAQSLIVDTLSLTFRFDLNRDKEDLAFTATLTPRPDTPLAKDLEIVGASQGLGAGIASDGPAHLSGYIAAPAGLKKTLDPLVDQFIAEGWKKAKEKDQANVKELLDILAPTLKAGILDFGVELRGPDSDKHVAALVLVAVKDADKIEGLVRKALATAPEQVKGAIKLDADKAGAISLHEFPVNMNPDTQEMFGVQPKAVVAFRKDAIVFAVGPVAEATKAVKSALDTTAKASRVLQGEALIRKLATVMEAKDPGAIDAAKRAYPDGISDAYRVTVTGGANLQLRFSASSRIIQFGYLMEQARRNR